MATEKKSGNTGGGKRGEGTSQNSGGGKRSDGGGVKSSVPTHSGGPKKPADGGKKK